MATTAPTTKVLAVSRPATQSNLLVRWHLLSLDAPTVAALWTWFLARADRVQLPVSSVVSMAVAVWMLYAADRLVDSRSSRPELEERHHFHRRNSRAFLFGISASAVVLGALLPRLATESLHLYVTLGTILFAYFILIHAAAYARRLPKELAVGVFFSAATFIPTVARQPGLRLALLPAAVLFAVLCSLNCVFIYAWEHPVASLSTHSATRIALRWLPEIAVGAGLAGLLLALADPQLPWPISAACALSALLLLMLHRVRDRFAPTTLRAAADLCLLTPILFLPLLNRSN